MESRPENEDLNWKLNNTNCTKKLDLLMKSNRVHTTTEVTTLPPSFNWKLKIILGSLLL
jgi:hypothetical protein